MIPKEFGYRVVQNENEATHVRIPLKTWTAAFQTIAKLPYAQVASVMQSLMATTELLRAEPVDTEETE